MNPYFRPRRSMLYVPGCSTRYLNKSRTLKVDSVILDLGDPILVEAKVESRRNVVEAVLAGGFGRREVVVRVNDLDSPWGEDDVKAVAGIGADAVLFPNVESRADVQQALAALDAAGGRHLPIMVMIESPLGVLRAEEIAGASDRIACIVMATSDLITQLHARRTPDRIALHYSLSRVLLAGRAFDRSVVDGISTDLKDMQSFEYACRLVARPGLRRQEPRASLPAPLLQRRLHAQAARPRRGDGADRGARARAPRGPRRGGRERPPRRGPPPQGRARGCSRSRT